jgi:hypothetical protein
LFAKVQSGWPPGFVPMPSDSRLLSDSANVLTENTCLAAMFDGLVAPIWETWKEP